MASYTVPKFATAVVFDRHRGPLRVERELHVVKPEVGEVLVKIAYSGVCREFAAGAIEPQGRRLTFVVTERLAVAPTDSDLHAWYVFSSVPALTIPRTDHKADVQQARRLGR